MGYQLTCAWWLRLPTVCLVAKKKLGPTWVQMLPN